MSDKRRIKKYANRRLYDTVGRGHITLAELSELIHEGESIEVVDDKTGADITRHILLQIIAEREDKGETLLSNQFLEQIVRFYGSGMQSAVAGHLESAMSVFLKNQKKIQDQLRALVESTPLGAMTDMSLKNVEAWRKLQGQFMSKLLMGKTADDDDTEN